MFGLMYGVLSGLLTLTTGLSAFSSTQHTHDIVLPPSDEISDKVYAGIDTAERNMQRQQTYKGPREEIDDRDHDQWHQKNWRHVHDGEFSQQRKRMDQSSADAKAPSRDRRQKLMRREASGVHEQSASQAIRESWGSQPAAVHDRGEKEHIPRGHAKRYNDKHFVEEQAQQDGEWFGRATPQIFDKHLVAEKERRVAEQEEHAEQLAHHGIDQQGRLQGHRRSDVSRYVESDTKEKHGQMRRSHHRNKWYSAGHSDADRSSGTGNDFNDQSANDDVGSERDPTNGPSYDRANLQHDDSSSGVNGGMDDLNLVDSSPYSDGDIDGNQVPLDRTARDDDADGQDFGSSEHARSSPVMDRDSQAGPTGHSDDPLDDGSKVRAEDGSPGGIDRTDDVDNVGDNHDESVRVSDRGSDDVDQSGSDGEDPSNRPSVDSYKPASTADDAGGISVPPLGRSHPDSAAGNDRSSSSADEEAGHDAQDSGHAGGDSSGSEQGDADYTPSTGDGKQVSSGDKDSWGAAPVNQPIQDQRMNKMVEKRYSGRAIKSQHGQRRQLDEADEVDEVDEVVPPSAMSPHEGFRRHSMRRAFTSNTDLDGRPYFEDGRDASRSRPRPTFTKDGKFELSSETRRLPSPHYRAGV